MTLQQALAERIAESGTNMDANVLAQRVVEQVERIATALVEQKLLADVLAHPELAKQWPLSAGLWWANDEVAEAIRWAGGPYGDVWHAEVTFAEGAAMLERLPHDPWAKLTAWMLRHGRITGPNVTTEELRAVTGPGYHVSVSSDGNRFGGYGLGGLDFADFFPPDLLAELEAAKGPRSLDGEPLPERHRLEHVVGVNMFMKWPFSAVAVLAYVERLVRRELDVSALSAARNAYALLVELAADTTAGHDRREAVTRQALARKEAHKGALAKLIDDAAHAGVAAALRDHAGELLRALDEPASEADATRAREGLLWWDHRFAQHLEALGKAGEEAAKQVREKGAERFRGAGRGLWAPWLEGKRFAHLALCLWLDVVAPMRRNPAGLVRPVMGEVTRLHSRTFTLDEENDGQTPLRFPDGGANIMLVASAGLEPLVRQGVGLLGSVPAHKVLRHEVFEGYRRAILRVPDARHLSFPGWPALAEAVGCRSRAEVKKVRSIVYAQAYVRFTLPDGSMGNLLAVNEKPSRGRRPGEVNITLGEALLPHYVYEVRERLGQGRSRREAQKLVPLLDVPPAVGRERDYGPQATLALALVTELRDHATQLVQHGGVLIDLDRFASLASRSGLPARLIGQVRDRWTHDGDDGPAFLEQVERDRYTLGESYMAERLFLEEAGRRELEGHARGKRSAAARAQPRRRRRSRRASVED